MLNLHFRCFISFFPLPSIKLRSHTKHTQKCVRSKARSSKWRIQSEWKKRHNFMLYKFDQNKAIVDKLPNNHICIWLNCFYYGRFSGMLFAARWMFEQRIQQCAKPTFTASVKRNRLTVWIPCTMINISFRSIPMYTRKIMVTFVHFFWTYVIR